MVCRTHFIMYQALPIHDICVSALQQIAYLTLIHRETVFKQTIGSYL